MSKETTTVIRCDICGREGAEGHSIRYDRRCDAAGSMEDVYYDIDLCQIHYEAVVHKFGCPVDYRERSVGRSESQAYGKRVKDWIEGEIDVWAAMSPEERRLALIIEDL